MKYRREIDGLRAIAVFSVIMFHAGLGFQGGFVGVDVFFVISGYLITTIILSELEQDKFSVINFYERRARRILPALFLVMLVSICVAWFLLLPEAMEGFSKSIIAVSVFASNIFFWREVGYFDTVSELKPLLHTWSLAVEEQYYVIFPLFLMIIWRLGKVRISVILVGVLITSLAIAQWSSIAHPSAAFFLLPTRGWELLIGALTAIYLSNANHYKISSSLRELCGWLGVALILYSVFIFDKETPFPGVYALAPTVGAVLVIIFATELTTVGKFIGNKAFVSLGLVSYSAYLWHQPLFAFARHKSLSEPTPLEFSILSLLTFILAFFSWRFVETPFRNKLKFKRKTVFHLSLVFTLIFVLFGYLGSKSGFNYRFNRLLSGDVGHSDLHQYIDNNFFDCEPYTIAKQAPRWKGFLRCKQSKQGIPDVILVGDSHAEHLFLGLAEQKPNINIAFYIAKRQPYINNSEYKIIFNELLTNHKPQHILLTMHFFGINDPHLHEGFFATIKSLKAAGKTVTILGDVPTFNQGPENCVYAIPSRNKICSSSIDIDVIKRQKNVYHSVLKRLSAEQDVNMIDIDSPFCTSTKCTMIIDKSVLYRDNNHLNMLGSRLVGKYIADQITF